MHKAVQRQLSSAELNQNRGAEFTYNYKATDIQAFEIDDYANTDFNDVIYMDKIISSESSNLIEKLISNNIAIASAWTLDSMSDDNRNVLKGKVESGIPLIVSGDSRVLQDIGISVITNPNASISASYCDPTSNVIYCYGIESSDYDAERTTIAWVNSVKTSTALDSDTNYGDAIFYQETKIWELGDIRVGVAYRAKGRVATPAVHGSRPKPRVPRPG